MGARQSSRNRNSEEYFFQTATTSINPHSSPGTTFVSSTSRPRTRSLFTSLNSSTFDDSLPSSSTNLSNVNSPSTCHTASTSAALNALISQRLLALSQSMHSPLFSYENFKCPVCAQKLPSDDIEYHLLLCLTKPRINYNDEKLVEDKGECSICLEDMAKEQVIARLPCLCIYHKECIDKWFIRSRSCPEHPTD